MRTPKAKQNEYISSEQNEALPLKECLAKTRISENQKRVGGRDVFDHCSIVGEVARELLSRMPSFLRSSLFPEGSELVAAIHDIGKVSPTFQEKIYRGTDGYVWNSLECISYANPAQERIWGGHAGVGMATAQNLKIGKYIPEIIGQHHGYSSNLQGKDAEAEVFGGSLWQEKRAELLHNLKVSLNTQFPALENASQAKAVAGLTTVADWIGSGTFFDNPDEVWQPLVKQAVDAAGFVWPELVSGLEFGDIFGFNQREIQQLLIQHAAQPGVYILEAPMGIGKTEAALYAAYSIMVAGGATGLYFALPTQLTSNKIHDRVNDFLKKIVAPESIHRHALLLHSNAWLKEIEMGEDGAAGGCWFSAGKRGILAPFAVGTIDQALMAVMNVKHGFVRAFGLAGKVVILDEVHSYDAYTGTILDRLVETLRALQCTVIILSATLTKDRRMQILKQKVQNDSYPLITVSGNKSESPVEVSAIVPGKTIVTVQSSSSLDMAMDEVLKRAEDGQQILWIENTVMEAQQSFSILAARAAGLGIECGLLHSCFVKVDRERNEEYWVTRYGKGSAELRQISGRILVGTQVLEQSLDIDADFLVTKICPTDMLLQRIGRLWRHSETIRPAGTCCDVWILKPEYSSALLNPEKEFGPTSKVYSPYVLLRTLEVWDGLTKIFLPEQIRILIEATYQEHEESAVMTGYKAKLQQEKEKLKGLALVGVSTEIETLPESKASTRYSEQENVEVLLLRSFRLDRDRHGAAVTLLDGSSLFLPSANLRKSNKEQRNLAATLASYTLHVTDYLAPEAIFLSNLTWLKSYLYLGDSAHEESLLRVVIVGEDGELVSLNGGAASVKYRISYNSRSGYRSIKR